jgi:hypothetical protein
MTTILALAAVVMLTLGCIGYGSLLSRLCGADGYFTSPLERAAVTFAVGLGTLGWILFFPGVWGYFRPLVFWIVCLPGAGYAVVLWVRSGISFQRLDFSKLDILLVALIALVAAIDVLEGISPPADADTLAYHFAHPKDFIAAGQVSFVPRAVSGAIPLLIHMTYAAALGTGGELALTLWVMVTGWVASLLVYVLVRKHVDRSWALAVGLIFMTTPAVLYGSGNGQVEMRGALFALAVVALMISGRRNTAVGLFVLGGLCAGFFLGAKFYGLIFVGAAGLVILFQRGGVRNGLVFGVAALAAGFQWYLWNWMYTGDPIFPTLTNFLQYPDSPIWTREFGQYFAAMLAAGELPLDRTVFNWLSYPVLSIFNLVEPLEGGRTGFGIFAILILPLAIYGLSRRDLRRHEFFVPLAVAFIFFTVWFFSGTAQRTRHLLPIYPLVLIGFFPLAVFVARRSSLLFPLAAGIAAVLAIQIAGQFVFGVNYATHVFSGEMRTAFLYRNVPGANSADWVNSELPANGKVGFINRQLAYLLPSSSFMMHPHLQVLVDSRATVTDGRVFVAQIRQQGLTHLLLSGDWQKPDLDQSDHTPFFGMINHLIQERCLKPIRDFDTLSISSRTLRRFGSKDIKNKDTFFELVPDRCSQ